MTFTVSLTELSVFIIAIAFLMLVVSAIPALIQLRQTARTLEAFSQDGKRFLADIKEITHKVNGQVSDMEESVTKLRNVTIKAIGIAEVAVDAIKDPVIKIAGLVAVLTLGLKHLRKRG
ncbi:MAG: DUF948 domain-containing protein [Nitrospinae bacterium]|nr:DUF948 domain-containing protein [Nitrospinota bacterium]